MSKSDSLLNGNYMHELHEGQRALLAVPGRFRVGICGRRFGKTYSAMSEAVRVCEGAPNRAVWWISPVLEQSRRVERELADALAEDAAKARKTDGWVYSKSQRALTHATTKSRIEFHSGEQGDRLRGAGLDLAILDEAADLPEALWNGVVKPMLLERRGLALIIGTPRGTSNWLHKLYRLAEEKPGSPYGAVRLPSRMNPKIPLEDLELFRADMSENEFRQEFEAEFVDGVDSVFKNVLKCVRGTARTVGLPGQYYVNGIDLGQQTDFTAIVSIRAADLRQPGVRATVDGFERFNGALWSVQCERILEHVNRFPGPCVVDCTGVGQPVFEELCELIGHTVVSHVFTLESKLNVVQGLALAFEKEKLWIPDARELVGELQSYRQTGWSASRRAPQYGAPSGLHDDCVTALGLAHYGMMHGLWAGGVRWERFFG